MRAYLDRKGYFQGVPRAISWALESDLGVLPGVTAVIRSVLELATGCVDTAFGLTEPFDACTGVGQGCKLGPCRSLLPLVVTQGALQAMAPGLALEMPVGARVQRIGTLFFADDDNFLAPNPQVAQVAFAVEGGADGPGPHGSTRGAAPARG